MGRARVTTPGVELTETDPRVADLTTGAADVRERAWRALYDGHYARVYRLVCRYGVEPADVEDLVQRVFVIAFRRIGEVGDVRDPGAWLRGIGVRVVAQHRRWRKVREVKRWLVRDAGVVAAEPMAPDRSAVAQQELARVRAVLDRMSGKLRDVLVLCDIEDCSPSEAAEALGIPVNTVRSRRRLARAKFQELWER